MRRIRSLTPVADKNARLLLLGSMPGAASLAAQQYYGYAHNHFWRLIFLALREEDPGEYGARTALLVKRGVALWDVIQSCEREGSLDKNIREALPNDIPAFLRAHAGVRTVCFNGTAAQRMHDRHFERLPGLRYVLLPSSSPVPRRHIRTLEDKLPAWLALGEYL